MITTSPSRPVSPLATGFLCHLLLAAGAACATGGAPPSQQPEPGPPAPARPAVVALERATNAGAPADPTALPPPPSPASPSPSGPPAGSCAAAAGADNPSALFRDFVAARASGGNAVLPDFSYAGYHNSERALPDTAQLGPRFVVTAYGAVPNDEIYDDVAVQAAINAAEDAGGGVVFFPAGRYLLSETEDPTRLIRIGRSGVVLQGAGAGDGGTELFVDRMKRAYFFHVAPRPRSQGDQPARAPKSPATLARIVADAARDSFSVQVDDASRLRPGQWVQIAGGGAAYNQTHWGKLWPFPEAWTRMHQAGNKFGEIHRVRAVSQKNGRAQVEFNEPLRLELKVSAGPIAGNAGGGAITGAAFALRSIEMIEEIGVEDIRFVGNWASYPEEFVHHKDAIHDTGWSGLYLDHVANSWVRRCEFRDFNQSLQATNSAGVTFEALRFTGKVGHVSVHVRRSYGMLTKDSVDSAGHNHGPAAGYWAAGTVYLRHKMPPGQQLDFHSGSPYATLLDQIDGGVLSGSGGPLPGLPHHGRDLVLWNFVHKSAGPKSYDFWSTNKRVNNTFVRPLFAGFTSRTPVTFVDEAVKLSGNESFGRAVSPGSLFDAQLALRKCQRRDTFAALSPPPPPPSRSPAPSASPAPTHAPSASP